MKKYSSALAFIGCLAVSGFVAHAADDLSSMDHKFVMKAAQGGMTEVELGKLAADRASSSEVKEFGAKMVTDHGAANDRLKSIATSKGITLSKKLDAKHQAMVDKLSALKGADFDKAYVDAMVADHKKDDSLFMKEASDGKDTDLKAFAADTDKTIKMHKSMIEDIKSKMK